MKSCLLLTKAQGRNESVVTACWLASRKLEVHNFATKFQHNHSMFETVHDGNGTDGVIRIFVCVFRSAQTLFAPVSGALHKERQSVRDLILFAYAHTTDVYNTHLLTSLSLWRPQSSPLESTPSASQ